MSEQFLSPPAYAKLLGVHPDKIRHWIGTGELRAVDLGNGSIPRWGIPPEARQDFERRRANQASASQATRTRRARRDGVQQFV